MVRVWADSNLSHDCLVPCMQLAAGGARLSLRSPADFSTAGVSKDPFRQRVVWNILESMNGCLADVDVHVTSMSCTKLIRPQLVGCTINVKQVQPPHVTVPVSSERIQPCVHYLKFFLSQKSNAVKLPLNNTVVQIMVRDPL